MQTALLHARRSNWVRLRTLIYLRAIAVTGQVVAIFAATFGFGLSLELGWCFLAVGAAIISNLVPLFIFPENKRLSEREMVGLLVFDITQLTGLLFLTGGLNNPFALLILAPVVISATTLQLRSTVLIAATSMLAMTIVTRWHLPLATETGAILAMPDIFVFGFWIAVMIGIVFLAAYARRVTSEVNAMSDALTATQLALSREQKLTDLGGVVAATAHELGTPLATIKLVSSEMMDEIDDPQLREDITLIIEQADRCRDILRSMGRAGKDDLHLRSAPVATVVQEAAEPHGDRGRTILYDIAPMQGANPKQPEIVRHPEIIHGLRNVIQNAVDFSRTAVWIDVSWSDTTLRVRIADDGPGFPAYVLPRLGDPFLKSRTGETQNDPRPQYESMGLGLFIAKTLLERSGAELSFANGRGPDERTRDRKQQRQNQPPGAIVESIWNLADIAVENIEGRAALGKNSQIQI